MALSSLFKQANPLTTQPPRHQELEVEVMRRAYQRSLKISVRPNGHIRVTAGKSVPQKAIHRFLYQHQEWIDKVLFEYGEFRKKYPPKQYLQGEGFLYLGQYVFLDFQCGKTRNKPSFKVKGQVLQVSVPEKEWNAGYLSYPQPHIKPWLLKFYQSEGKKILAQRTKEFSQTMKLYPTSISFRSQKTRWGSCSSRGNISLNWRLLAAPSEVLDYVVIHELAHLKQPNHSKDFWRLVQQYSPNYEVHKNWLQRHHYDFDFLAKISELHPQE